jgi:hypothetical protein
MGNETVKVKLSIWTHNPGEVDLDNQINEYMTLDDLLVNAKIYAYGLYLPTHYSELLLSYSNSSSLFLQIKNSIGGNG